MIADRLLGEGHYEQAVEGYRRAIAEGANDAALIKRLGTAYAKLGQYEAASESFRWAAVNQPSDSEAYLELGQAQSHLGNDDAAQQAFRLAIEMQPDYLKAHARLGYLLDDMGMSREARAEYSTVERLYAEQKLTKGSSSDPDLYDDLGRVLSACGRTAESKRAFGIAADLYRTQARTAPYDPDLFAGLGFALDELDRSAEAVVAYKRAVELRPKDGVEIFNLGVVLERTGAYQEAIDTYRRAVDLLGDSDSYAALGTALAKAGRFDEAADASREAIKLRDGNADAWAGLGMALTGQGQDAQAEDAFRRSCSLSPDPETARRLAQLLLVQNRPEDAEVVVRQLLDADDSWRTLEVRAALDAAFADKYRDDGYYSDCASGVTEALKKLPPTLSGQDRVDQARLYYQRATAYTMLADYGKAKLDFQKCINCADRNSPIALSATRSLRRINSRYRRPLAVPAPLPYLVTVLALAGMGYGAWLVERGKLSATEYFPLALGFILVIFAAFSLPSITTLKLGPAEMDKQVVVISIPPPDKLK
jgi:tetratricopeptide (TPR) repeat protein